MLCHHDRLQIILHERFFSVSDCSTPKVPFWELHSDTLSLASEV